MPKTETTITFADLLRWVDERQPLQEVFTFAQSDGGVCLTGQSLYRQASAAAAALLARGLQGERIILPAPQTADFVIAFYACILSGAIAVPIPQPRPKRDNPRYTAVVKDARPKLAVADEALHETLTDLVSSIDTQPDLISLEALVAEGTSLEFQPQPLTPDMPALIQFTSGSTGDPKGAIITHGNLIANSDLIARASNVTAKSRIVSWLPFFHDMGLSAGVLMPVYTAGQAWLMTPTNFLKAPMSWVEAMSEMKSTIAVAPNFAFELLTERAKPEALAALDLSHLNVLMTGSEPVNPKTLDTFTETFAPARLRPTVLMPVYGLAEYTLMASGGWGETDGPTYLDVDAASLLGNEITGATSQTAKVERLVGNGLSEGRAAIVEPTTREALPEGAIGEIWLTGPSLSPGYWEKPEINAEVFGQRINGAPEDGPYYRTGDLGFLHNDHLFVTGRSKDLIIVRGRNHYPRDLEETATRGLEMLTTGAAAAFSHDLGQGEEVVLMAELTRAGMKACADQDVAGKLVSDIRDAISDRHELALTEVVLVKSMRIPRTTSGKIQRQPAKALWLADDLDSLALHRWKRPVAAMPQTPVDVMTNRAAVETWLVAQIAAISGLPPHEVALDAPFSTYGFDSLTAVRLVADLDERTPPEMHLDPTDLYDYPTVQSLLDHHFAPQGEPSEAVAQKDEPSDLSSEMEALRKLLD